MWQRRDRGELQCLSEESPFIDFILMGTYLEEKKPKILLSRTSRLSTTAHLQCNTELDVISRMYKYYRKF